MRFSVAAIALAGSAVASYDLPAEDITSTAFISKVVTITSCAPEVTDCPNRPEAQTTIVTTSEIPLTTSTIYKTNVKTITDCPPEVTNCPAHKTHEVTETVVIGTTVCPVEDVPQETGSGEKPEETESGEKPEESYVAPPPPAATYVAPPPSNGTYPPPSGPVVPSGPVAIPSAAAPTTLAPAPTEPAAVCEPSSTVKAITKSYTTVLTTVEYETIAVPCATEVPPPAGGNPPPAGGNSTVPVPPVGTPSVPPPAAAGAGALAGSAVFAAIAGVAAFILA